MSGSFGSSSAPLAGHLQGRSRHQGQDKPVNVGHTERMASLAAGGGLVLYGLSRGSIKGLALALLGGAVLKRGVSGHCSAYKALGMSTADSGNSAMGLPAEHGIGVEEIVTIFRPREELYKFWRDLSNLPGIMHHLKSVQPNGNGRSHWVAEGPLGYSAEWDAEILVDRENEMISWRSVEGSSVETSGSVHFLPTPDNTGTVLKVTLMYDPPAGKIGDAVARMLGQAPSQQIHEDLQRFKQVMESGASSMAAR